jgi:hypothetical protein
MKASFKAVFAGITIAVSQLANAWIAASPAKVTEMWHWEGETAPVYFKLSTGQTCWITADEKAVYTFLMSLHMTGKSAQFLCHDEVVTFNGMSGHRLHRVASHP